MIVHSPKTQLWLITLLAMIGSIGISLPCPIFAPMLLDSDHNVMLLMFGSDKNPAVLFGALLAVYPLGLFLGSPILGSLSDRYGRQKLIVGSLFFATFGYAFSAWALHEYNLTLLLFSRFLTGFMEGNISILRAAVADRKELNKHQAFGMIGTGITIGYTIGPLLGACLTNPDIVAWFNFTTPFILGACTTFMAAMIAWFAFPEDTGTQQKNTDGILKMSQIVFHHFNIVGQLRNLCRNRSLKFLFISGFCFWFAVDAYYEFYPAYLVQVWNMDAMGIALLTGVLSLAMVLGNGLSRFFAKYFADIPIIFWHIVLVACMLIATLCVSHLLTLYMVFSLAGIFVAITSNHFNVQISETADADLQGEALGMIMGLRMLGDAAISFSGGFLIIFSTNLPLICAAIAALIAALIVLKKFYYPFLTSKAKEI